MTESVIDAETLSRDEQKGQYPNSDFLMVTAKKGKNNDKHHYLTTFTIRGPMA